MTACIMEHLHISQFLGILVVMLVAAKVSGYLAQRLGQPAVLGELIGGVLVGKSVLGLGGSAASRRFICSPSWGW